MKFINLFLDFIALGSFVWSVGFVFFLSPHSLSQFHTIVGPIRVGIP